MDLEALFSELELLNKKKSISAATQKKAAETIEKILAFEKGASQVLLRLKANWNLRAQFLKVLIKKIEQNINNDQIKIQPFIELLEHLSINGKVNFEPRWMALSVYLNADFSRAGVLFKEYLSKFPGKTRIETYEKYLVPYIQPDFGLPFLLLILNNEQLSKLRWILPLTEKVAEKAVIKDNISDLTICQLEIYLEKLNDKSFKPDFILQSLILLALQQVGKSEKIREQLRGIPNILCRNTSFQELSKQIELAIDNVQTQDIAHIEKERTTEYIPQKTTGELMEKYLVEIKDMINNLEKCRIIMLQDNDNLKKRQIILDKKILETEEEKQKIIKEYEEKVRDVKERTALNVKLAQDEAMHAVVIFKAKLWKDLQTSLFEAQDQNISTEGLPVNERIYLERLREILIVLTKHGIAN